MQYKKLQNATQRTAKQLRQKYYIIVKLNSYDQLTRENGGSQYKKLGYCWETVRRESMPRIAEMDVEMTRLK